jgi:hypothetical protein
MSNQADSFALSPLMFGEAFFAGAAAMQRHIAQGMMVVFDAVADAMSDSLRASAELAHEIGNAQTPVEVAAASCSWFQGRVEKGLSWFRALAERMPFASPAPQPPEPQILLPAAIKRAPGAPQVEPQMPTKPPAGKLRRAAPIVIEKLPKKPARPAAK